jgi:hypothetical protein
MRLWACHMRPSISSALFGVRLIWNDCMNKWDYFGFISSTCLLLYDTNNKYYYLPTPTPIFYCYIASETVERHGLDVNFVFPNKWSCHMPVEIAKSRLVETGLECSGSVQNDILIVFISCVIVSELIELDPKLKSNLCSSDTNRSSRKCIVWKKLWKFIS